MNVRSSALWSILAVLALSLALSGPARAQSDPTPLIPQSSSQGIIFSILAPNARQVQLAGSFNNWGSRPGGDQPSPDALMDKGSDGVFRLIVPLGPGTHRFRFVVDGEWQARLPIDPDRLPCTPEGENILRVRESGSLDLEGTPYVYMPRFLHHGVEFRLYAPNSDTAFLAGSFNNWGNVKDGVITDYAHKMFRVKGGDFVKVVRLEPGEYSYMINLDQRADRWLHGAEELPLNAQGRRAFVVPLTPPTPTPGPTNTPAALDAGSPPTASPDAFYFPPRVTGHGVQFAVYHPTATTLYLPGEFNGWGNHVDGSITNEVCKMESLGGGYFSKTLFLPPDTYRFKYCVDGTYQWESPDLRYLPNDDDKNGIFTIEDGRIKEMDNKKDPWPLFTPPRQPQDVNELIAKKNAPAIRFFYTLFTEPSEATIDWVYSVDGQRTLRDVNFAMTNVGRNSETARKYLIVRLPTAVRFDANGREIGRVNYTGDINEFIHEVKSLVNQ
ncbi:MAG: glycogen-binding domain-containing protein [Sumerlaeia bacterium]